MKRRIGRSTEEIINHHRTAPARVAFIAALSLIALISAVKPSGATIGT